MPRPDTTLAQASIAVIDDSPTVCRAVETALTARGAQVTSYSGGLEALRSLPGTRPDLILCDILLPDIKGFEVCSTLRRTPALNRSPIVLISGVVDKEVDRRARTVGAIGLLKKPFTDQQLVSVAQRVLARRSAADASAGSPREAAAGTEPRHRRLVDDLRQIQGLRHGLILENDEIVAQFGAERLDGAGDLRHGLSQLLEGAQLLFSSFGSASGVDVLLETPAVTVLVHSLGDRGSLIASFESSFSLGRIRLALRRHRGVGDDTRPHSDSKARQHTR